MTKSLTPGKLYVFTANDFHIGNVEISFIGIFVSYNLPWQDDFKVFVKNKIQTRVLNWWDATELNDK